MNKTFTLSVGATLLAAATFAGAEPVSYTVDTRHASVTAESRHFGTSTTRSRFAVKSGNITIDPAAKTGKATIVIDVASVNTGVEKLDEHIKSISFLDAAGFPEATLVATAFTFDGDKVSSMTGDLTLHGKSGPVTLKSTNYNCYMSPAFKKQVCGGDFETTIQRSAWDVKYLVPLVSDDTKLVIQVEASKD